MNGPVSPPFPRWRGGAELLALSQEQHQAMLAGGIVSPDDATWREGYLWTPEAEGQPFRLSIDQYHRLLERDILPEPTTVELLEGLIVTKDQGRGAGMGHGNDHAAAVRRLYRLLLTGLGASCMVQSQLPIGVTGVPPGDSEPEPDAAIARGCDADYDDHPPRPDELYLVVEASDTSLAYDRGPKLELYARAGIRTYWVLNLVDRQLDIYWAPDPIRLTYSQQQIIPESGTVTMSFGASPPVTLAVSDLLP